MLSQGWFMPEFGRGNKVLTGRGIDQVLGVSEGERSRGGGQK